MVFKQTKIRVFRWAFYYAMEEEMAIDSKKEHPGDFVVVEGVDGAGKSTVIQILVEKIKESIPDREVVAVRLPDGAIREILLRRESPLTD